MKLITKARDELELAYDCLKELEEMN